MPSQIEDLDMIAAYAPPMKLDPESGFVRCNMISSYDGAVALDGRSGTLGGPADRRVFQTLRSWADVILVGAGTVRAEGYGPARLNDSLQVLRRERGQRPLPQIAIVTRSGNLDWGSPLFTDEQSFPLIVTTRRFETKEVPPHAHVDDVIQTGHDRVDLQAAFRQLRRMGRGWILLEGGPALNRDVLDAGLLDELCLTLSPCLAGGSGPRLFGAMTIEPPVDLRVVHVLEEDGYLFYRLVFGAAAGAGASAAHTAQSPPVDHSTHPGNPSA